MKENQDKKEIPAITSEVKRLLVEKIRVKKKNKIDAAEKRKRFIESVDSLFYEVEDWFAYLNDVGASCKRESIKMKCNFGDGHEDLNSSTLVVELEELGEVLSIKPLFSEVENKSDKLRFHLNVLAHNKKTLVFWPIPFTEKYEAQWYVWENEDNRSEAPTYRLFDEKYVMEFIKARLT
ncbi:hypothetical protein IFU04_25300 [Pseudomonas syringae]|nr:hypothetical protein [Pseudomonas syringae]